MDQLTAAQMGAVANARQALSEHAEYLPGLIARLNASTSLPWATDAEAFFGALGDRASALWLGNGKRIEFALGMGVEFDALTKPARVCIVCADGHVVPTSVPFPSGPIAVWHIPAATKADALTLAAKPAADILAALAAAQPVAP